MPDQIAQLKGAGFSDEEIGEWTTAQRSQLKGAGFNDDEISQYLGGGITVPAKPPSSFLDRLSQGTALGRAIDAFGQRVSKAFGAGAAEGYGAEPPSIFSEETEKSLRDAGILPNPEKGYGGPLRFANEALLRPLGVFANTIGRATSAGISGIAGALGEVVSEAAGETQGERAKREVENLGNFLMADAGSRAPVSTVRRGPLGEVQEHAVGNLPSSEDLKNAATTLVGPDATTAFQEKLKRLYEEKGLHPAEVAHDAATDATVTQALASRGTDLPERYTGEAPPEPAAQIVPAPAAEVHAAQEVPPEAATPIPPPAPTGAAALPEAIPSAIPNAVQSIRPGDLTVDADRFQFKSDADEAGVTDRLQGVQQWDPVKAGLALVWEDQDGGRFIVDGHQRVALAKRIAEADPAQDPHLNAIVLRQADGVSDTEARVIAAAKNIAEGTGTPIDAAKILRDQPELIKELPPRSALVQQARGLAALEDEPFRMVVNEVVPPAYGALVGRLAPGDGRLQGALIDLLNKTHPANLTQAEAIIRQGIEAGTRTETQATLFGDQQVTESLYLHRAQVLDRALQQLKRDRLVFSTIVRDQDIIQSVGNRLETSANASRATADAQAVQILQVLANRRGPLSDALNNAARRAANGDRAGAVREFVDAVRGQAESGDLVRAADGLERGRADAGRQDAARLVDPDALPATARADATANDAAADAIAQTRGAVTVSAGNIPGELPIVRFRRDAAAIEATLPPVQEGFTRLWRGNRPGEVGTARQFTNDLAGIALPFREPYGGDISYVDVRTSDLPRYEQVGGAAPGAEFLLPEALGAQARAVKVTPVARELTAQGEQFILPGAEPSALQAQAAREAEGRGRIAPPGPQEAPGGLFEEPAAEEPELKFGPETGAISWAPPRPPRPGSLEEAQQSILSKLSIDQPGERRPLTLSRLYTAIFDKLYPLSEATPRRLAASQNPYRLARLLAGLGGKIDHMLRNGTFDWRTYEINGPSLEAVLAPVKDDLDGFRAFITAARGLELESRDIMTGLDLGAMRHVLREGIARYGPTLENLINYQNRVAEYLRDSGVLSADGDAAMREANQLYVPFQRVLGDGDGFHGSGATLQASNPINRIKGSERDIIDPIESVIRNTAIFVTMAEKNAVGTSLVDMLLREGELGPLQKRPAIAPVTLPVDAVLDSALRDYLAQHGVEHPEGLLDLLHGAAAQPAEEGTVSIFRDGTRYTYQVDPELARAMKGLDAATAGMMEKLFAPFSRMLRAGALTVPDFALRHTIRDFLYGTVTGRLTPLDMVRGIMGQISKDDDYWLWLQGGGANNSMISLDRRYLQENLERLTQETGLMTRAINVVVDPNATWLDRGGAIAGLPFRAASRYVLRPLQVLTQLAEDASHLGSFKREMRSMAAAGVDVGKEEIQAAAWTSRDIAVDASRIGAKTRAYNMISAFANIALQDSDRVVRAFVNDPVSTSLKVGGWIVAPSALLWWAQHDDPRYEEIPRWERDLFWVVLTDKWEDVGPAGQYGPMPNSNYRVAGDRLEVNNGAIFRIPKPWGMGLIFGSGTERALEAWQAGNPDAFKSWAKSIADVSIPNILPTAAGPIINQWTNRDAFTNRTLVPANMEKWLPEYQYTPYTTEAAKALGQIIGAFPGMHNLSMAPDSPVAGGVARALTNPMLLENYIRGWSGNLGIYALQLADAALRKEGILPDPPKPASTLADIPVVKAFVVRYPTASAQSIQDFYDAYEVNKSYYDTWLGQAKAGDAAAAQRIQGAGGPQMFVQLDQIHKTLTEHSQLIRDIYKDPEMKPAEKRQLIDQIYFSMIQVGQAGKAIMQQVRTTQ